MLNVETGQCGLCVHFGEGHKADNILTQIRTNHQAKEDFIDDCGHPKHAALHLKVTAVSGCDGFSAAVN